MLATGAGAASRQSIGTTVFGGMLAATILTLAFVPVFYAVIERLREGGADSRPVAVQAAPHGPATQPAPAE
jgi:HAE1 family hydrophobic/amphiphilic exporter-1